MKKLVYLVACAIMGLSLMGCSSTLKDQARQMETVYFANNSTVISQSDQTKINNFVINHKGSCRGCAYLIQVDGYTNTIGTEAYNLKLSERRADAVKKALIKAGVTPCRKKKTLLKSKNIQLKVVYFKLPIDFSIVDLFLKHKKTAPV